MSKGQMLRVLVKQRLTAAAEEIFGLFERTIAEYEEELCRSKEENERQRELLDAVFKPQLRLHRADVQQLSLRIEEVPSEKREWSRCLDQKDAPKPPHIKEEQEEEKLWTSVEGELLEETLTPIPVKKEDDVEKPQTSQLHQTEQMKTEPNGEDCGGPALDKLPDNDEDSPESETEDNDDDWEATREPESGSNFLNNNEVSVSDVGLNTGMKKTFICSECGKRFNRPSKLMAHKGTHTEGRPFSCSVCSKTFGCKTSLQDHVKGHKRERNFCCSLCGKCFLWNSDFELHMRTHTGEKPFSCTFCNKTFTQKGGLQCHLASHTGEKPFSCSICSKTFGRKGTLWKHMIRHSGEKRFSCPLCKKCFYWKSGLHLHMRTHTGEKPFSCPICGKTLGSKVTLQNHVRAHTGEKPFSCSLCGKMFGNKRTLQNHVRTHTGEKPYSCRVCDRRFVWHWQLRKHKCSGESSDQGPP